MTALPSFSDLLPNEPNRCRLRRAMTKRYASLPYPGVPCAWAGTVALRQNPIPISFSAFGQRSPENLGFSKSLCTAHTAPERTPLARPAAPGSGLEDQPSAEATGQHSARKRPVKMPDFSKTLQFFDFHPQFLNTHSTTACPCAMPGKSMESSICHIFLLRFKGLCKEKTHLENAHFGEKHSAQKQQELRLQPSIGSKTG